MTATAEHHAQCIAGFEARVREIESTEQSPEDRRTDLNWINGRIAGHRERLAKCLEATR